MSSSETRTRVLIAGAGPTGLSLACELARRGVPHRLVDAAPAPFSGSRGKGLQPRTLEVFDDLGIIAQAEACGSLYPHFRYHAFGLSLRGGRMSKPVQPKPDVPHPNLWMLPQWRTEELLRGRLEQLGGQVEFSAALSGVEQDGARVFATLTHQHGSERVACEYLVGCDGGHSFVRGALGVRLSGEALAARPVLVADLELSGLDHEDWHVWPLAKGCLLTLCPLPGTRQHQLAAPLAAGTPVPELTEAGVRRFLAAAIGGEAIRVERAGWISLYRAHVRMVDRYRVGRVFLAGDAAHVHPPAGGQGLNTGIQDAYNLGWKLTSVLNGAPDILLESYERERLPIAASVLGLSKRLQLGKSMRRDSSTQQLGLSYRGGPLAHDARANTRGLSAGDRAPDAPCIGPAGEPRRLFDVFRGPHWTLLSFGTDRRPQLRASLARWSLDVRCVCVQPAPAAVSGEDVLVDVAGHARRAYGVAGDAALLVRPDGYIGFFASPGTAAELEAYLARVAARAAQPASRAAELPC